MSQEPRDVSHFCNHKQCEKTWMVAMCGHTLSNWPVHFPLGWSGWREPNRQKPEACLRNLNTVTRVRTEMGAMLLCFSSHRGDWRFTLEHCYICNSHNAPFNFQKHLSTGPPLQESCRISVTEDPVQLYITVQVTHLHTQHSPARKHLYIYKHTVVHIYMLTKYRAF